MGSTLSRDDATRPRDELRAALLAAFAHELRTPITSLGMVLGIARRTAPDPEVRVELDAELQRVFQLALRELQQLADDIQEVSRIERGVWQLSRERVTLSSVLAGARELLEGEIALELPTTFPDVAGRWDRERPARALADLARTADRLGAAAGSVRVAVALADDEVQLTLASGDPTSPPRPIGNEGGFRYERARFVIREIGGNVEGRRAAGYGEAIVALPIEGG